MAFSKMLAIRLWSMWEKAILILAGNLNSGHSYLITAVPSINSCTQINFRIRFAELVHQYLTELQTYRAVEGLKIRGLGMVVTSYVGIIWIPGRPYVNWSAKRWGGAWPPQPSRLQLPWERQVHTPKAKGDNWRGNERFEKRTVKEFLF